MTFARREFVATLVSFAGATLPFDIGGSEPEEDADDRPDADDAKLTGVVDRIEREVATVLLERAGETIDQRLVATDRLPKSARAEDSVLSVTLADGEIAELRYDPAATRRRRTPRTNDSTNSRRTGSRRRKSGTHSEARQQVAHRGDAEHIGATQSTPGRRRAHRGDAEHTGATQSAAGRRRDAVPAPVTIRKPRDAPPQRPIGARAYSPENGSSISRRRRCRRRDAVGLSGGRRRSRHRRRI